MESLGDILRRISVRSTLNNTNGNGVTETAPIRAADLCSLCNGSGWVTRRVYVGHPDFGQAVPCQCQETEDSPTLLDGLRRYSNLGSLSRVSFAGSRPDGPLGDPASSQMFSQALAVAASYAENPEGWLVLSGPSGSGKTHLAAAVANRCIERRQTAFFIVVADLLDHLRATFSPDSPISYDELFEQVRNVPLLVLDDLGPQTATAWAQEKLFQVINHRFNNALPTVITVRGPIKRLDETLRTRLEGVYAASRVLQLGHFNSRLELGIGEVPTAMLSRMTFENFDLAGGRGANTDDRGSLGAALESAKSFAYDPDGWLLLDGPHGCGKTHLAVAVAGVRQHQGDQVFFAFVPTLLDHLRATFSPDSRIGYDELFEQINTVPLLVLDDLGAETSTPWAEEKLYQIIVHRHEARMPTVITTIPTPHDLMESKPRIASRLVDINLVTEATILAPNYRDQRQNPRSR